MAAALPRYAISCTPHSAHAQVRALPSCHAAPVIAGSEATKGRTSLTCHLAKKVFPCPIMLQKIQNLTNKPFGHMELPQVARYASSQRYVEHYDGVDPHTEAGRAFCASGGQRVATVLMYLNKVSEGGATRFK
jgi:prolyl 4-hydroxylase